MKRLVVFAALMLLCSLLVPLSASARFGDSTRGNGETVSAERFSFSVEGSGGVGSISATGTWKHTFTLGTGNRTVEGRVFCLVVFGNRAVFAGFVTKSPSPLGQFFVVTVEDNNGAGADRYGVRFESETTRCTTVAPTNPIVKGRIEVVESTFPT
jgi:hypothetical protein